MASGGQQINVHPPRNRVPIRRSDAALRLTLDA
jgi:hypothetical protein